MDTKDIFIAALAIGLLIAIVVIIWRGISLRAEISLKEGAIAARDKARDDVGAWRAQALKAREEFEEHLATLHERGRQYEQEIAGLHRELEAKDKGWRILREKLEQVAGISAPWAPEPDATREKPPLGITPRFILREQRIAEIRAGIERYEAAAERVPDEWRKELEELTNPKITLGGQTHPLLPVTPDQCVCDVCQGKRAAVADMARHFGFSNPSTPAA